MKENIFQAVLAAILAGAAAYFHVLLGPLVVLLIVMIIDYITGMAQAWRPRRSARAWASSASSKRSATSAPSRWPSLSTILFRPQP